MHCELCSELTRAIDEQDLMQLGKLEQACVYGDASTKEVLAYLQAHPRISSQDKVSHATPVLCVGLACWPESLVLEQMHSGFSSVGHWLTHQ